eukprot:jgi/Ulvmu1/5494/UM023_0030.1
MSELRSTSSPRSSLSPNTGTSSSGSSSSSSGSGRDSRSSASDSSSSSTASSGSGSRSSSSQSPKDVLSDMLVIQRSIHSKQAELASAHKANMKELSAERDRINSRFSDLVLSKKNSRSKLPRPFSPRTREHIVSRFQESQAFTTARLTALRKGKSLSEAEQAAEMVGSQRRPKADDVQDPGAHVRFQSAEASTDPLQQQNAQRSAQTAAGSLDQPRPNTTAAAQLQDDPVRTIQPSYAPVYHAIAPPQSHRGPQILPATQPGPYAAYPPHSPAPQYTQGQPPSSQTQIPYRGYTPWDPHTINAWHGPHAAAIGVPAAFPPHQQHHMGPTPEVDPHQMPPPHSIEDADTSMQNVVAKRLHAMTGLYESDTGAMGSAAEAPHMQELREMLVLLRTALAERTTDTAAAPPEDELRDLERQIARQKKVTQLATVKAKSEALRLRQEFELEKFRAKYRSGNSPYHSPEGRNGTADAATRPAGAGGNAAAGQQAGGLAGSSSDGSLSISSGEAFDEPLKVVSVEVARGGPFAAAGWYRVTATLYTATAAVPTPAGGPDGAAGGVTSASTPAVQHAGVAAPGGGADGGSVTWHAGLALAGAHVDECSQVVLEVYRRKQSLLGVAQPDEVIAWTAVRLREREGAAARGLRCLPLYNPPLSVAADAPRFPVAGAGSLHFYVHETQCRPGDLVPQHMAGGAAIGPGAGIRTVPTGLDSAAADAAAASGGPGADGAMEQLPAEQYVSLTHDFKPPLEPYQPGAGIAVLIDGLRFLPGNVSVASVAGTFWSSRRESVATGFHMVPQPSSDALSPHFFQSYVVGAPPEAALQDATTTLMLEVATVDRFSQQLRVVGYSALPLFARAADGTQPEDPADRSITPNAGAFQLPLWPAHPPLTGPLCAAVLHARPRLPCASVLVRVMPDAELRSNKHPARPLYTDNIYDSRLMAPTDTEKVLYEHYAGREAGSVRSRAGALAAAAAAADGGGGGRGLQKSRSMKMAGGRDAGGRSETVDAGAPPPAGDADLVDWALARLMPPPMWPRPLLDLGFAHPYLPSLGFSIAVDGAARLGRMLPAVALTSVFPPGSFYQDHPVSDDVKATLLFDLDSPLLAPRWLDGPQPLRGHAPSPALIALIDVRYLVPATGSSTPAGFAVLPVLRRPPGGAGGSGSELYVATAAYQLPLFKGLPSMALLAEMKREGDVDATLTRALKEKRLQFVADHTSVLVRVLDEQRPGQASAPVFAVPEGDRVVPRYAAGVADKLTKPLGRAAKSLRRAVPGGLTDDQFVHELNAATLRLAGLAEDVRDSALGYGDGSAA